MSDNLGDCFWDRNKPKTCIRSLKKPQLTECLLPIYLSIHSKTNDQIKLNFGGELTYLQLVTEKNNSLFSIFISK